jgi:hypothetical protein
VIALLNQGPQPLVLVGKLADGLIPPAGLRGGCHVSPISQSGAVNQAEGRFEVFAWCSLLWFFFAADCIPQRSFALVSY